MPRDNLTRSPDVEVPKNAVFHSPDPVDQLDDPLDQSSENRPLAPPSLTEPILEAYDIRAFRKRLRLTQRQFAAFFGFPVATLRHWERGNRRPTGTALVLLNVVRDNPRVVRRAVLKLRRWNRESLAPIEPLKSHRARPGYRRLAY